MINRFNSLVSASVVYGFAMLGANSLGVGAFSACKISPIIRTARSYQGQRLFAVETEPPRSQTNINGSSNKSESSAPMLSLEETTEKYGLEVGLWQSLMRKTKVSGSKEEKESGGDNSRSLETAQGLLKKYGLAYLATSIPLAVVSFALCYVLVDRGIDVAALLSHIGLSSGSSDLGEKAGTVALAYAAHKAASPLRFPPTVLLTPVVAKLLGKEPLETDQENQSADGSS